MISENAFCPLCNRRNPDVYIKMHYQADKVYQPSAYYTWKTKSIEVPVCSRCKKWRWFTMPYVYIPLGLILFLGLFFLARNWLEESLSYIIGIIPCAIVIGVGSAVFFVRGRRLKGWMKIHMPDEARRAGMLF